MHASSLPFNVKSPCSVKGLVHSLPLHGKMSIFSWKLLLVQIYIHSNTGSTAPLPAIVWVGTSLAQYWQSDGMGNQNFAIWSISLLSLPSSCLNENVPAFTFRVYCVKRKFKESWLVHYKPDYHSKTGVSHLIPLGGQIAFMVLAEGQ